MERDSIGGIGFIADSRELELEQLAEAFLSRGESVVAIVGPPGVGKTSLALTFGAKFLKEFPGGVHRFSIGPGQQAARTTLRGVPHTELPTLVMWHLEYTLPDALLEKELVRVRTTLPSIHLLITARELPKTTVVDRTITLQRLSKKVLETLRTEVRATLGKAGYEAISTLCEDNPLVLSVASDLVSSGQMSVQEVVQGLGPLDRAGILGPDGRPLKPGDSAYKQLRIDISSVNDNLIRRLAREPERIYEVSPRKFEEIVAELLTREGFEVTLTPASRDGGKDIYAAQKGMLGELLFVVECKRYAPNRPVGIGVVQRLFGVVQAERANAGIIVTTARGFSSDAVRYKNSVGSLVSLRAYLELQNWFRRAAEKVG